MECKDCKYARIKNAYNSSGKVGTIIVCHITNKKKEGDACKRFRQNAGLAHSACNGELLTDRDMKEIETKYNKVGIPIAILEGRKYIISCSKFDDVNASGCPCVGQIATNNKLLALFLYHRWNKFSIKYTYSIAVQLWKRNAKGNYDVIKR